MSKGASKEAEQNVKTGQQYSAGYQSAGQDIAGEELPFLKNELTNPQGFGQKDLSQMLTQSGQSIGGAVGSADEAARLAASRTGNPAAIPGVIDQTARNAMAQESNNALDVNLQNAKLKQQQQQEGMSGLQQMYGTDVGAALNALGLSTSAVNAQTAADAQTQSALQGDIGMGLDAVSMCPARGARYLMADGSEKLVEELEVGDQLAGIDGEPETIEEIQSAMSPVLLVKIETGYVTRTSPAHAFAPPYGGFTEALNSLGKTIVTASGNRKVTSVELDGEDEVFSVITDGSHTYRADGVWALGVGEAEHKASMNQRQKEFGDVLAGVR